MPFLWVSNARAVRVDESHLARTLCPYGEAMPSRAAHGAAVIWHTRLARWVSPSLCQLPVLADGLVHRSGCSAFGEVEVVRSGFRFATDELGTLPLWRYVGQGFEAVTCEVKALTAITGVTPILRPETELVAAGERAIDFSPYTNIQRLPPGSIWEVRDKNWQQVAPSVWPALLDTRAAPGNGDTSALGDALSHAFDQLEAEQGGAFISGGIDSSIAATLLGRHLAPRALHTWSLGTRVGNEFAPAAELARHLLSRHHEAELTDEQVLPLWRDAVASNEIYDGMTAEIVLQLLALVGLASGVVSDVATGYGADLLFGGMLRHEAYMKAVGVDSTRGLIARTWWSGELSPFFAWRHGVAVHPVFWSAPVLRAALTLDPSLHFDGTHEKVPLRRLAVSRGWLPEALAFRTKMGMTVGTAAYQLVSEQLKLSSVMDYTGRSRRALADWLSVLRGDRRQP